jgi:Putative peptidoglycan binding domain
VNETRPRGNHGSGSWTGAVGTRPHEQPLDDWLGDISDEDWSENAAERAERRRATPAYQELAVPEGDLWRDPTADRPAQAAPGAVADAHRAVIERRRLLAGLVLVVVLGLAVGIAVLLLRGGAQAPVTPVPQPATTTPTTTATSPSSTPTTPSTAPTTTTPTTPSTSGSSTFALPEGTKLRLGEGDPVVIKELQQALSTAGYDPGTADGTFGQRTEAAVIAFQQANGLSPDGIVGPETASALNSAVAGG